jgi:hypothetical protein
MPKELSGSYLTAPSIDSSKLGQPQPLSNLEELSNNGVPQALQQ